MTREPAEALGTALPTETEAKNEFATGRGLGAFEAADVGASERLDRSFARSVAWVGGVKWLGSLFTWTTTILTARILAPSDYGILSMASVVLSFIVLLSESGLGITVVRTPNITKEQLEQLNGGAVMLGVACCALACLTAIPLGRFYDMPALPLVVVATSANLVISSFRVVPSGLLQRNLEFSTLALIEGSQAIVQATSTITLAYLGYGYWSLVVAALLGSVVGVVGTLSQRRVPFRRPRSETLGSLVPFTRGVLQTRLLWYAYQNADFIVAGKRLGVQALGAYSYAWTLASIPVDKISAIVGNVTAPVFATVQNDAVALRRYFLATTEALSAFTFPLTIGMALVANDFVPVVLGPQWVIMVLPLRVLAAYASVRTISPIAAHMLVATGDVRYQVYLAAIGAVVLPSAFFIGSSWGTVGIAVAWTVAHPVAVFLPLTVRVGRRLELGLSDYLLSLWPAVSGCLVMTGGVLGVGMVLPPTLPQGLRLTARVLTGALAYGACLMLFHRARVQSFLGLWRSR